MQRRASRILVDHVVPCQFDLGSANRRSIFVHAVARTHAESSEELSALTPAAGRCHRPLAGNTTITFMMSGVLPHAYCVIFCRTRRYEHTAAPSAPVDALSTRIPVIGYDAALCRFTALPLLRRLRNLTTVTSADVRVSDTPVTDLRLYKSLFWVRSFLRPCDTFAWCSPKKPNVAGRIRRGRRGPRAAAASQNQTSNIDTLSISHSARLIFPTICDRSRLRRRAFYPGKGARVQPAPLLRSA
ncbi:hypothetical protein EVAR_7389_1 [Eumeta japonica]|uniref:Uncharacterized protein n=1 Tax=Eumeta variegata TaxID=151549 RepID=A0A4C1V665_EUMVA|nr:hypothetical protein EVAR_7389_1 [Eumeta japonica]